MSCFKNKKENKHLQNLTPQGLFVFLRPPSTCSDYSCEVLSATVVLSLLHQIFGPQQTLQHPCYNSILRSGELGTYVTIPTINPFNYSFKKCTNSHTILVNNFSSVYVKVQNQGSLESGSDEPGT